MQDTVHLFNVREGQWMSVVLSHEFQQDIRALAWRNKVSLDTAARHVALSTYSCGTCRVEASPY